MSQQPSSPTKRDRRDAARAERQAREQAAADAAIRRKRLQRLGVILGAAVIVVIIAIVVSSGGKKTHNASNGGNVAGVSAVSSTFDGLPQSGITVGNPNAKVTIVEFADPQCPFCKEFAVNELPAVIRDQVKTGKAKMELRLLTFIGPDSVTAGHALEAAGLQNKMWQASDLMYHNQGQENSGYVNDAFLRRILGAVNGLNVDQVFSSMGSTEATNQIGAAKTMASRYGVNATPTILVGPTNGKLKADKESAPTAAGIAKLVDAAAKQ